MHEHLERLRHPALDGDVDAAHELALWVGRLGAEREPMVRALLESALDATPEHLAMLTLELAAHDTAARLLDACWTQRAWARFERGLASFGLVVGRRQRAAIDRLIAAINTRRPVRLLARATVLHAALEAVTAPHGFAWHHSGEGPTMTHTSLAFAVLRPDGAALVVGAALAGASRPTPGRGWRALQPWHREDERNVEHAHAWALEPASDGDRVALQTRPRPASLTVALELAARARALRDPIDRLLDDEPTRSGFAALCAELDALAARQDARLDAIVDGVARALDAWPDGMRRGGPRWLDAIVRARREGRRHPGLELVRRLELADCAPRDAATAALRDSGLTRHLRELDLDRVPLATVHELLQSVPWTDLERVRIVMPRHDAGTDADARDLAAWIAAHLGDLLGRVEALGIGREDHGDGAHAWLQVLQVALDGTRTTMRPADLVRLVVACPRLRSLTLARPSTAAFACMGACDNLAALERLTLSGVSAAALATLVQRDWPALETLTLDTLDPRASLVGLRDHAGLASVRHLTLGRALRAGGLHVDEARALAGAPVMGRLESLGIELYGTSFKALRTLLSTPALRQARELRLGPLVPDASLVDWLDAEARFPALERVGFWVRPLDHQGHREARWMASRMRDARSFAAAEITA